MKTINLTKNRAFRVSRTYPKILRNRKQRIQRRLQPHPWPEQDKPMMAGSNIHYEMAQRTQAISCGGIGAMHLLAQKSGLVDAINQQVVVLDRHLPYHESDHVLNVTYNILAGGVRLQDLELRRQDEAYLNSLAAQRLPDPTTAGDFTRRFEPKDIEALQEAIHTPLIPAQIIQSGRKIVFRLLSYNGWLTDLFATWERLRRWKGA
jgi:hypothetical protein